MKYWGYCRYAAKSQLKSEVANSYLNWIWWILEPFCLMLIYSFVFGFLFKHKEAYYNVYIFIGLSVWDFFGRCVRAAVSIVKANKPIVSKVYLPKFILIISNMMVNGFKMFVCLGIAVVMMIVYRVSVDVHFFLIIPVLLCMILFTFGCCTILLHLGVFIDDMNKVITIVLRFTFYLSGIFYNIEKSIPKPYNGILLTGNPIALFAASMRDAMLYGEGVVWWRLGLWFGISVVLAVFGVWNIYRSENNYVKVI